jgi:exosortase A-associated hydrolase 2
VQFVGDPGRRILVVSRPPAHPDRPCVLLVPPFGEEMNKTRAMYADVGRRLARRGYGCVLPDLYGTGDSDGEFRDANWTSWCDDLVRTCGWARHRGWRVCAILATRLGCALAAAGLRTLGSPVERSVFWQPVTDGARYLQQFLRLRVAASMMDENGRESAGELRARLRGGDTLEISGYELTPTLADHLETIRLRDEFGAHLGDVHWIEVVRDADSGFPAAAMKLIEDARGQGVMIEPHTVPGEPFWSSVEIVRNERLVSQSVALLSEAA